MEIIIAIIIVIAISISIVSLVEGLSGLIINRGNAENLGKFISQAFNIVIAIEFLRMLSKHTVSSIIEVLLFAIARQLIVEHTNSVENLITIITIAILFGIRKYLLISSQDKEEMK